MPEYPTLEAFADYVRNECAVSLGALCVRFGPEHPVSVRFARMERLAAEIVLTKERREGQAGVEASTSRLLPLLSEGDA